MRKARRLKHELAIRSRRPNVCSVNLPSSVNVSGELTVVSFPLEACKRVIRRKLANKLRHHFQ